METYPRGEILASPGWLAEHLNDPTLKIVDARGPKDYEAGHIPGAVVLSPSAFKEEDSGETASPEEFARTVGRLGIRTTDTVVCYDGTGPLAARAWWAFTRFGHHDVRFLNGGIVQWAAEGHPSSTDPVSPEPVTYTLGEPRDELACSLVQAKEAFGQPEVAYWDTRTEGEYQGAPNFSSMPPRAWDTFRAQSTSSGVTSWSR